MDFSPKHRVERRILALVFPDTPEARALRLEPVAESLLVFGARASLCSERPTVWLDISGCAHLHASCTDVSGEQSLAMRVCEHLGDAGIDYRVVVASGPLIAEGVARHLPGWGRAQVRVVAEEEGAKLLALCSLRALCLSAELEAWLRSVGCQCVGDLAGVPRAALGPRLGAGASAVLGLLQGQDLAPLVPYEPPVFPEARLDFEEPAISLEALSFSVKTLSDKLAEQLDARAMAASGLRCTLHFDASQSAEGERAVHLDFSLVTPLYRAADMLGIVRAKLQAHTLPGPVTRIRLRAQPLVLRPRKALHLFAPESKAERVLPQLVAELEAELGEQRVGTLSVEDAWRPEARSKLLRVGGSSRALSQSLRFHDAPVGERLSGALVPTRLLSSARELSVEERSSLCLFPGRRNVERLEAVEWWKQPRCTRDFGAFWSEEVQAEAWVEWDAKTGDTWLRGWFD